MNNLVNFSPVVSYGGFLSLEGRKMEYELAVAGLELPFMKIAYFLLT